MTTPSPSACAVARADALMDTLGVPAEGQRFTMAWRRWEGLKPLRDRIALALDETRADERERAAKIAMARGDVWRAEEGLCAFSLEEECEDIAAAIRAPAPETETDNG